MKCGKCGLDMKKQAGNVYGQPQQKSEYYQCSQCGLRTSAVISGIQVFDELDVINEKKKKG